MKRRVSLSILFFVFLTIFVSCNWFNTNNDNEISFTITGKLITNGAMPQNYDEAMNARTALATAPSGKTIQYKVLLLAAEGATEPVEGAVSEVASDGSSYTIRYTGSSDETAQYYLRAVAYYMDGTSEVDVLVSPDTPLQNAINLKQGSFSKDLEMRPATSGYGEVSLTITLDSATMCDSVTISDVTHFQITKSDSSVTISHKATSAENLKVASGSYPVTVNFYKTVSGLSTPVLVYQFSDVINVFNNLTTNVWVDNGNSPHLTTDDSGNCSCSITEAMLEDFKSTNFYVDKSWTGEEKGTYAEPFKSLKYALQYIYGVGNNTSTYTIHVKENADLEVVGPTISINNKIKIEVYKTISGKKDGTYTLNSGASMSLLEIAANGELTLESDGTGGLVLKTNVESPSYSLVEISGKMVMHGGCITGTKRIQGYVCIKNSDAIFEMCGGQITGNTAGPGIVLEGSNSILKLAKKAYIYGNSTSGNPSNVVLPAGKTIQVAGPLEEGALIGVTAETEPTITGPVTITTGYGYQTGGYNAGVKPGRYFRGDSFGVTDDSMLESPAGEAVLAVSGGSISTKVKDDITIEIDHTNASNNTADRKFTFTVTKDKGAVAPATSTDLTSAEGLSYSYRLKDHADIISNSPTAYYSTSANTLTLNTNLPAGKYNLEVEVSWDGNKYQAAFDVGYVKVDVPSGCVAVMGSTWNSSTTLCAGDADRKSNFFIAGRNLTIPTLIACDHEVTQAEYARYMNFGRAQLEAESDREIYPVYFVDWYAAILYCNLLTLNDVTFGSTRSERLVHCAYSLNGEKDPEQWISSIVSGSRITKSGSKFSYTFNDSANTVLDNGLQYDLNADGWRLPLDVEWEYLARGGSLLSENQTIYSGSNIVDEVAWYAGNSGDDGTNVNPKVHEIKNKKPNSLKLYDMSGNLFEWCWDWGYKGSGSGAGIEVDTPITGLATNTNAKSVRGGCFLYDTPTITYFLPTKQYRGAKSDYNFHGFRVVRTVLE